MAFPFNTQSVVVDLDIIPDVCIRPTRKYTNYTGSAICNSSFRVQISIQTPPFGWDSTLRETLQTIVDSATRIPLECWIQDKSSCEIFLLFPFQSNDLAVNAGLAGSLRVALC
jgi:hypothetical protein